jgi:hypothetical protein
MKSFNFSFTSWSLPHWVTAALVTAGGAALSYAETAITTGGFPSSAAGWEAIGKGAGLAALAVLIGIAKQMLGPSAQRTANALKADEKELIK